MANTALPELVLRLQSGQVIGDEQDFSLINESFGIRVTFLYSGCPGVYPKQQLQGVILDVTTCKNGERYLLVKAEELNLPKWVKLNDVQFVPETATALTVETVNAA